MLITYANAMGKNLKGLDEVLDRYFPGVFGGVHILPFFPSSGDRGFAVIHYDTVDPAFGDWHDIDRLAEKYYLMADFMLNHISIRAKEFQDYMARGDASPYRNMFIHWDAFWPNGEPTEADMEKMYRRKANGPYLTFTRADGKQVKLWNTFFEEQIDIDPYAAPTQAYYERNLGRLADHVPLIRFDAFAYASKRPGTSCFFVEPDIWNVLDIGMRPLRARGTEMLPEIHENYHIQMKMAEKGYWVYDFALPMLLLHALMTGRADRLNHWLQICPRKQFTTLDTHDGIGMVDVADLLTDEEIDLVRERVDEITLPAKPYIRLPGMIKQTGKKATRYQLNCTYYSALGADDDAYLLARAVQFFAPGIPQVYYVGLLAGENDIDALKRGEEPRSINRHTYTEAEIAEAVKKPMLQRMYQLMRLRNTHPAFDGDITIEPDRGDGRLTILRKNREQWAELTADFKAKAFTVRYTDPATGEAHIF
ncbi:MAG: sucrose phosphorylase [Clostridia bacterium]|nr:sucrose phosphorylase [Clostridia bacterium]